MDGLGKLLIPILMFWGLSHWFIRKKLNIKNGIPYMFLNRAHQWIEISFLLVSLVVLLFLFLNNYPLVLHHVFLYLVVISIFRAFMEWRFAKGTRRYLLNVLSAAFSMVLFVIFEFGDLP